MLTKDDFIIRGFNCIHLTCRDIGGRACGGVLVMVRYGIPYSECKLYTTLQAKAVTISTSKTITVCSLYLPPSENLNNVLLTRLIDQLPTPFVICGDFNGHSMTWVSDLFSPLADGHDQHIVLFPRLSLLPFIEQGLETVSVPTPHPALRWCVISQSYPCYLTQVAWNNLPASVVVSEEVSTSRTIGLIIQ